MTIVILKIALSLRLDYAQNGNCDDITNTPECLYDNKNCCENDFHHTGDSTCLDPYPYCPAEFVQLIGNGYCDDVTNRYLSL